MPDPLGLSLLAGLLGRGRSPSIGHGLAPLVTLGGGIPSLVYSLSLLMGICCRQPHSLEAEASCFSLCPLSGHPVSPILWHTLEDTRIDRSVPCVVATMCLAVAVLYGHNNLCPTHGFVVGTFEDNARVRGYTSALGLLVGRRVLVARV